MPSDNKSLEDASRHLNIPKTPKQSPAFICAQSPSSRGSAKKKKKISQDEGGLKRTRTKHGSRKLDLRKAIRSTSEISNLFTKARNVKLWRSQRHVFCWFKDEISSISSISTTLRLFYQCFFVHRPRASIPQSYRSSQSASLHVFITRTYTLISDCLLLCD